MIELQVLGEVVLRDGGRDDLHSILAQPKRLAVLAYLCLNGRGGFVRRDTLTAIFWPDLDQERARAALSQSLYVLRRSLGSEVLPGRGSDEVAVDLDLLSCDAVEFRKTLDSKNLPAALDLYRGDLLPGLYVDSSDFDRWLDGERASLCGAALAAATELGSESAAREDPDSAVAWFRRALDIMPESNSAAFGLIENLWRGGHRSAALAAYERFSKHLEAEYGVRPGEELQSLVDRVRKGSVGPRSHAAAPVPPTPVLAPVSAAPRDEPPTVGRLSGSRSLHPGIRTLLAFGLGIATIVLIAGWLGGDRREEGAWYNANQAYLKAWAAWDTNQIDSARNLALRAVELDSTHVSAWALVAYTGALLNAFDQGQPADLLPSAYEAAVKAVQLDDTAAAARVAHAVTRWTYRREWEGAERDYRHSLTLSPGPRWEAVARADLSGLLENLGRCEEAWEVLEPYAAVDPRDRIVGSGVVIRLHYMCRNYGEAIAEATRVLDAGAATRSDRKRLFLARLEVGDTEGAEADLLALEAASQEDPWVEFGMALLAARTGDVETAIRMADRLSGGSNDGVFEGQLGVLRLESVAQLYAAVGDVDGAFHVLSEAFEQKGHVRRLMSHPLFEPLWDDPRFESMLTRMTLRCRREGNLHLCQPLQ
ncbi:MAG: hypothetical protein KJO44_05775 [Gemmatimonadetes bacterium]|nr:hypothetical protein [Gemmatimonadota bacterium]